MWKLRDCETLEQLADAFDTKLTSLKNTFHLRNVSDDPKCHSRLVTINRGLCELDVLLALMRAQLRQHAQAVQSATDIHVVTKSLEIQTSHMSENIPGRLKKVDVKPNGKYSLTSQPRKK